MDDIETLEKADQLLAVAENTPKLASERRQTLPPVSKHKGKDYRKPGGRGGGQNTLCNCAVETGQSAFRGIYV
ncbi:MAG: hypothetical protein ACLR2M_00635 [Varibaculum sp.]